MKPENAWFSDITNRKLPFEGRKRRTGRAKYNAKLLDAVRAMAACILPLGETSWPLNNFLDEQIC